jgi:hypothetical protein
LQSAERQTGRTPEALLVVPLIEAVEYLWQYFIQLSNVRTSNGFGPNGISFAEIYAWQQLTGQSLDCWELDVVLQLDQLFLANYAKHSNKGS